MKKAGIITFHCADNFGAVLQVYALQQTIKEMEIDVEIIDFKPRAITSSYNHDSNIKFNFKKIGVARTIKIVLTKTYNYSKIKKRLESYDTFRRNYLKVSDKKYYSNEELLNDPPNYDFFITGSDQVWNPKFKKDIGNSYFLDFVKGNARKISYSASIAEKVDKHLIKDYKTYINNFDYLSIREKSSLDFLKSLTNKDVAVTLDPTLLLVKEKWDRIVENPMRGKKYILVYDLQQNKELIKLANKLSEEMGVSIISFSTNKDYNNRIDSFQNKRPDEFLGLLKNAELVLTNSFHGTVFSVIYKKLFYVMPPKTRQSRLIDFLKDIKLEDRVVNNSIDIKNYKQEIDYNQVNNLLKIKREESINFLKKSFGIND
ncbi:polysaccharide pyruvyl transferase family protein [Lysinibacillus yapensis]|nr:polysaccharide pyruvyl transferase family protein [Lysinibacillus yapensis]